MPGKPTQPCTCEQCGTAFKAWPYRIKRGDARFCSRKCWYTAKTGQPANFTPEGKARALANLALPKPIRSGPDHPHWKGEATGYSAKHAWLRRKMGKAPWCQNCPSMKTLQWANIDGLYARTIEEYVPLCRVCHEAYDRARLAEGGVPSGAPTYKRTSKRGKEVPVTPLTIEEEIEDLTRDATEASAQSLHDDMEERGDDSGRDEVILDDELPAVVG